MLHGIRTAGQRATRTVGAVIVAGCVTAGGLAAAGAAPALAAGGGGPVPGLPAGAAAAALAAEPALPVPSGWRFPDAFSRTSGTGRLIGGALEWSDWVYDAYGASSPEGVPLNSTAYNGVASPAQGDYVYPSGAAGNDGADIFRAAVGLTPRTSVWRVDWNTLADPAIPIAEWTFDTDDDTRTGAATWPGAANVRSPGIERALIVSSRGAELIDVATGRTLARLPTVVDRSARSFLVTIPRSVMRVSGRWRVRLAAGLADASGTGFAVPSLAGGQSASAGAPRVYNVGFRTAAQEPPIFTDGRTDALVAATRAKLAVTPVLGPYGAVAATSLVTGNFWGEDNQADTLAGGDIAKFSALVDWRALARRAGTEPPLVKGYSDRWYVTGLQLGQGVNSTPNADPAYLGRIQPYAVYVPTGYDGRRALPFTWMLHSLTVNYNQYGAFTPRQIQEECRARDSICASPEGFGPAGNWTGNAENDFWQVWRQVASSYRIAADRTVLSGYSMGGEGSFKIGLTYPADFSEAMPLDGLDDGGCSTGVNRAANAHWEPYVISNAAVEEESPLPDALLEAAQFEQASNRFNLFTTSMPEHNVTAAADGFATQVAALGGAPTAPRAPGTIDYTWCSALVDPALGLGPTAVYWISGLSERLASASSAHVVADDGAIPTPTVTEQTGTGVVDPADAPPMARLTGSWVSGPTPPATRTLSLGLTNVAALSVDTVAARLAGGGLATVTSDGGTALTLTALSPGTVVHVAGASTGQSVAGPNGSARVALAGGTSTLHW